MRTVARKPYSGTMQIGASSLPLESGSARKAALRKGDLIDVSIEASTVGFSGSTCFDAASWLHIYGDIADQTMALGLELDSASELRDRQIEAVLIEAMRLSGGTLGTFTFFSVGIEALEAIEITVIVSSLDSGEMAATFYLTSYWKTHESLGKPRSFVGIPKLPTADDLVGAMRDAYCDSGAPLGARESGLSPAKRRPIATANLDDWSSSRRALATLARRDPQAAAIAVEAGGDPIAASDCWILAGDIAGSLEVLPPAPLGTNDGWGATLRLTLSLILGRAFDPADLLSMHRRTITDWGAQNLESISTLVSTRLAAVGRENSRIAEALLSVTDLVWSRNWEPHGLIFDGWAPAPPLCRPQFAASYECKTWLGEYFRIAENVVREARGHKPVGHGWVAETEMFLDLREAFGHETEIVQHGSPHELISQHLDVWIPEWRIGIEYQGRQHDEPVDFFGGEEGFRATVARDATKRDRCQRSGIVLIEVRPGYDREGLI